MDSTYPEPAMKEGIFRGDFLTDSLAIKANSTIHSTQYNALKPFVMYNKDLPSMKIRAI